MVKPRFVKVKNKYPQEGEPPYELQLIGGQQFLGGPVVDEDGNSYRPEDLEGYDLNLWR